MLGKLRIVLLRLETRSVRVPMPGNAEAIEDYARSVRAVERVEMNTRNIIFKKIPTLLQSVLDTDTPDHCEIILPRL